MNVTRAEIPRLGAQGIPLGEIGYHPWSMMDVLNVLEREAENILY